MRTAAGGPAWIDEIAGRVKRRTISRSAGEDRRWGMVGELELRGRTDSTRAYEPGPSPGMAAPAHAVSPGPLAET